MSLINERRHQLDLASLHRECERNYGRIRRLVESCQQLDAQYSIPCYQRSVAQLRVIEVTKFTSTLSIVLEKAGPEWLPNIALKVRVYRDARMAEVIEWCSDRTIPWALVEKKGLQSRDEKWQWNLFFSELLVQALSLRALEAQSG